MAGRVDISARSVEDWSQGPSVRLAMEAGSQCCLAGLRIAPGPERAMMERTDSIPDPFAGCAGVIVSVMLRARPDHPECSSSPQGR